MIVSDAVLSGAAAARGEPGWFGLAAAPILALMALGTARSGGAVCSASLSPFDDMTTMYLVMSALHLAPWLRLARRQSNL